MASATYTALDDFVTAVDVETTRIGVEFDAIMAELAGGVSATEAQVLIARAAPLVANLKAIGSGGAVVP